MNLSIIVAMSRNRVIGKDNQLIWHLPADLKRFKSLTTGHVVIMGRKTFESIGKALPNRTSIVVTKQEDYVAEGCETAHSLDEALEKAKEHDEVFVIGGGTIYREAMDKASRLYLTLIHRDFKGDTFFPEIDRDKWESVDRQDCMPDDKNPYPYSFIDYKKKFDEQ